MTHFKKTFRLFLVFSVLFSQSIFASESKVAAGSDSSLPGLVKNYNANDRSAEDLLNTSVDPFTGKLTAKLPLLDIPGNDGLNLKLTLTYSDSSPHLAGMIVTDKGKVDKFFYRGNGVGYQFDDFTGIIISSRDTSTSLTYSPSWGAYPVFIDPEGNRHELYSKDNSPGEYISKDNWKATLTINNQTADGTVYAPDGTQYQVKSAYAPGSDFKDVITSPVQKIISPQGGNAVDFQYKPLRIGDYNETKYFLSSISMGNFSVNFDYDLRTLRSGEQIPILKTIKTSNGAAWTFAYTSTVLDKYTIPQLKTILLPDNRSWQFDWVTTGKGTQASDAGDCSSLTASSGTEQLLQPELSKITYPDGGFINYDYNTTYLPAPSWCVTDRISPSYVVREVKNTGNQSSIWNYIYTFSPQTYDNGPKRGWYNRNFFGRQTIQNDPDSTITTTKVTGPDSIVTYTFNGNAVAWASKDSTVTRKFAPLSVPSTGLLLSKTIQDLSGKTVEADGYKWEKRLISSGIIYSVNYSKLKFERNGNTYEGAGVYATDLTQQTITRDGITYTINYNNYDQYGQPAQIIESGPGGTLVKNLTYYSNADKWIFNVKDESWADQASNTILRSINRDFNKLGELNSETVDGVTTQFTYDDGGNLKTTADALGHITTSLDYKNGQPTKTIDAAGNETDQVINDDGTVASKTNALHQTTSYLYNNTGLPIKITLPQGQPVSIDYNTIQPGSVVATRGNNQNIRLVDGFSQTISDENKDLLNTANDYTTYTQYNPLGEVSFESYPTSAGATAYGTQYFYDALQRPIKTIAATTADGAGGAGLTTSLQYLKSTAGFPQTTVVDPKGNVTSLVYQAIGAPDNQQLVEVDQPNNITTKWNKSLLGEVQSIMQNNIVERFIYDAHHYLQQESIPEIGTISYGRDLLGQMTSKQINKQPAITYQYTPLGELDKAIYPDADRNPALTIGYDVLGREKTISKGDTEWIYDYDANGNMVGETFALIGSKFPYVYNYNDLDQLTSMTYPDGHQLTFKPNGLGEPTEIAPYASNLNFYPNGSVSSYQLATKLNIAYNEDPARQVTKQFTAGDLVDFTYNYDNNDNITDIVDNKNTKSSEHFGYDVNNWLTAGNGVWGEGSMHYDTNGNLLNKTMGAQQLGYHYDANNRLNSLTGIANGAVQYDDTGNVTELLGNRYAYNSSNQLVVADGSGTSGHAFSEQYAYDGNGNRYLVTNNGAQNYFIYAPNGLLLTAMNGDHSKIADYFYLNRQRIADLEDDKSTEIYDINLSCPPSGQTSRDSMGNTHTFEPSIASYAYFRYAVISGNQISCTYSLTDRQLSNWKTMSTTLDNASNIHYADGSDGKCVASGSAATCGVGYRYTKINDKLTTTYFVNDHLGSPILATDDKNKLLWQQEYLPYGAQFNTLASSNNNQWYIGKYQDPSDLLYIGARYYSPLLGRFLSTDPENANEENPLSVNRYAYANNNPYLYEDPDGDNPVLALLLVTDVALTAYDTYNAYQTEGISGAARELGISAGLNIAGLGAAKYGSRLLGGALKSSSLPGSMVSKPERLRVPDAKGYSVFYETKIDSKLLGSSYSTQNRAANRNLISAMENDSALANMMNDLGVSLTRGARGGIPSKAPEGFAWHHTADFDEGILHLVSTRQHQAYTPMWNSMHPGGFGGMSLYRQQMMRQP